jgi:hypothetical protein
MILSFLVKSYAQNNLSELFTHATDSLIIKTKAGNFPFYTWKISDLNSARCGLELDWMLLPAKTFTFKIGEIAQYGNENRIFEKATDEEDIVLISGGFWGYSKRENRKVVPVGLVISNGAVISDKSTLIVGGILYSGKTVGICTPNEFKLSTGIKEAIQCSPMLVKNAKNSMILETNNFSNRMIVAITNKNELLLLGAFMKDYRAVTLFELAEFLVTKLNVNAALAFDGAFGPHIYIPQKKLQFGFDGDNNVMNIIHFKLK